MNKQLKLMFFTAILAIIAFIIYKQTRIEIVQEKSNETKIIESAIIEDNSINIELDSDTLMYLNYLIEMDQLITILKKISDRPSYDSLIPEIISKRKNIDSLERTFISISDTNKGKKIISKYYNDRIKINLALRKEADKIMLNIDPNFHHTIGIK